MSDKLGSMCRSCLATEVELLPLNAVLEEPDIPSIQIDECLQMHMNVIITPDDGLPYNICMNCKDRIMDFRKFCLNYMKSEVWLMHLLLKVKSEHLESDRKETADFEMVVVETEDTPINKTNEKRTKLIYCLQCHETFSTHRSLRLHFTQVHGEDNERGYCNHCGKAFPTRAQLMKHLKIHPHISKVLKCPYCERTFANKQRLKSHVLVHTGVRPYPCKECGRSFRQESSLGTHLILHTGKTIECPKCDKKFVRKSYLDVHMRTHDDVRPYACHICDKKFRAKNHLTTHLLIHSNVLAFNCHICGKLFKDKSALSKHVNAHIKPYHCPRCPQKASKLYLFRSHLVNKHGIHDDPKLFMINSE